MYPPHAHAHHTRTLSLSNMVSNTLYAHTYTHPHTSHTHRHTHLTHTCNGIPMECLACLLGERLATASGRTVVVVVVIVFVGVCVGGRSVWVCGCVNVVRDVRVDSVCMYEHV